MESFTADVLGDNLGLRMDVASHIKAQEQRAKANEVRYSQELHKFSRFTRCYAKAKT
jgi:hypothetical protein